MSCEQYFGKILSGTMADIVREHFSFMFKRSANVRAKQLL